MTAPIVTASMREWADAYVFACRDHAAREGCPFDASAAERAIREALTEGARYSPRAEAEAEFDGWQPDDACAHHGRRCLCDEAADRDAAAMARTGDWL